MPASQEPTESSAKLLGFGFTESNSQPLIPHKQNLFELWGLWNIQVAVKLWHCLYKLKEYQTQFRKLGAIFQPWSFSFIDYCGLFSSLNFTYCTFLACLFCTETINILSDAHATRLHWNIWELINIAYCKFAWQVSSLYKQYFFISQLCSKMAFCPIFKLTNSVRDGIFIALLNTSVNTTWCNWVLLCDSDSRLNYGFFKVKSSGRKNIVLMEF